MTSAKRSAAKPEDLDAGAAVEEVESKSKVSTSGAGRPNDNPIKPYKVPNSTFASRAKGGKRIGSASNKAVTADESKSK